MIVTTAGHIDHGKTALVRALTGMDTDRLPEEKARGITVDLGFAHRMTARGGTMGFVDVPGHERLVRTMVAGASGVDCVLLVVAADDGVMPQTREHVAVLDLLGVRRAVVALTKVDRVDAARVAAVGDAVAALLAGTGMAGAPAIECDTPSGIGVDAVAAALEDVAAGLARPVMARRFRLAVDRSFVVPGAGLVAAGFVHAGSVKVGDRLVVSPAGHEVRVRGIQAHEASVGEGRVGERIALNLAGPRADKASVGRGAWLVDAGLHRPTRRMDVQLRLLPSETRAMKHWTPVHLHLGTASVTGRVGLAGAVERGAVEPGGAALAQLVLDAEIAGLCGDRFALRDASGQRTIGGGVVLDPFVTARRGVAARLEAWAVADDAAAFAALLAAEAAGVDLAGFRQARNLGVGETVTAACVAVDGVGLSEAAWAGLQGAVAAAVAVHHEAHPDDWGPAVEEVTAGFARSMRALVTAAVQAAVTNGAVLRTGRLLHRPGREIRLAPADAVLWEETQGAMLAAGLDPLRLSFLAERLGCEAAILSGLLDRLARIGWVQRASAAYYLLPEVAARLLDAAREVASDSPDHLLTVGRFRERTGIGRHATMPVLEFFDRTGSSRRVNEGRVIRKPVAGSIGPS